MTAKSEYALTRLGYIADFLIVPVVLFIVTSLALRYGEPSLSWLFAFACGYVAWTLAEYCIHRWVLHGPLKKEHWMHHIRPNELIGASSSITFTAFAVLWLFFLPSPNFSLGQMAFAGVYSGYFVYCIIHTSIHHVPEPILQRIAPRLLHAHNSHHRPGGPVNYGVQTLLWDRLFGTYRK